MMNVLRHPSFFRPASRPSSPPLTSSTATSSPPSSRPGSSSGLDRGARSLNKLSLSSFRRPSPAPNVALNTVTPTLVQDGSYLEVLSLKLSEAVSRALAQPTGPAAANEQLLGKRPIPQGRGHALGALIASYVLCFRQLQVRPIFHARELKATQASPHLHRAIVRSLHRPLSVLLTSLSAHLLPLISSPAFQHAPAPTVQSPNPNPTQLHAMAIATFVSELLETFDVLELGTDVDLRGDGLKPIREGLVSLINRVVGPLVGAIRNELMPLLAALETPNSMNGVKHPGVKAPVAHHPSIVALQALMPVYAKAIARYTTSTYSQTTLATFLIAIVWRGLVALSHRPWVPSTPPSSPGMIPIATKKSRGSTPPLTPPLTKFSIKLPPSRPPSPPATAVPASTAADARALFDLFGLLPLPIGNKEATTLAREVVDDALEGLEALPPLLEAVHSLPSKIESQEHLNDVARGLEILATEVPLLIALPVVLQAPLNGVCGGRSVGNMIGLSEDQYRKECLSGFGRAEECSNTVALRALDALLANPDAHPVVSRWLEMEIAEAMALEQTH
ncbi:hypothetical protein DXG03_002188 [Asterophora parasitica]|uniref:Uncharacterized protein n=1 Tax=Asterophora parasitica TaxID=117018 RepID=A0A9P7KCF6_9AGAR|nr:hypothetical protein DXG03_002188 [Asterophora parasitica]